MADRRVKLTEVWHNGDGPNGERHYEVQLEGEVIGEVWQEGYHRWRGSHRGEHLHSGVGTGRINHLPAFAITRRAALSCVLQAEEQRCQDVLAWEAERDAS